MIFRKYFPRAPSTAQTAAIRKFHITIFRAARDGCIFFALISVFCLYAVQYAPDESLAELGDKIGVLYTEHQKELRMMLFGGLELHSIYNSMFVAFMSLVFRFMYAGFMSVISMARKKTNVK